MLLFVHPLRHGVEDILVPSHHIDRVVWEEHGGIERAAMRLGVYKNSQFQKAKKNRIILSKIYTIV